MNLLLTGCAGFIGSQVAALLLEQGHTVMGIDNLNDAYDVRLKEWRLARLQDGPGFRFHPLDITGSAALRALFESHRSGGSQDPHRPFEAVLNLGARAGVRQSVKDPWSYYQTNLTGTLNLLDACREYGVPRLIQASTSSVYGAPVQPADPGRSGEPNRLHRPFAEGDPTDRPLSPYAASKKAAEELCHSYHHLYGLDVAVLRYFTVYGPAGRPDMSVFRFIAWIDAGAPVTVYGDGSQQRDFTYVEDIARGTAAALGLSGFEVINLGSDRPVALREVIRKVEGLLGKKADLRHMPAEPTDVPATWADISRARRLLDWSPRTSLEDGLANAVAWYRENRSWAGAVRTA